MEELERRFVVLNWARWFLFYDHAKLAMCWVDLYSNIYFTLKEKQNTNQ